ncbi:hypothetical protein, partial [Saccharopolyspora sp. NPDC002578]
SFGVTSAFFSLRDLFPEWLRHEGKSSPREKNAENPRRCRLLWWSLLSGSAADRMGNTRQENVRALPVLGGVFVVWMAFRAA